MKNQTYIRCPRCELNYILKKDKYCNVCKLEMKALGTMGAENDEDLELCPICKVNYINPDEEMCPSCASEREYNEEEGAQYSNKKDSIWNTYTSSEEDDDEDYSSEENGDMVSITNLDDTPISDDEEMDLSIGDDEEEQSEEEEENFDDVDFDESLGDIDDIDENEEDEEDYDEIDDEDDFDTKPSKRKK